ncbi:MAG: hypothetical protein Fur0032_16590 [Terrimicrobiaceae bacterium]
MTVVVFALPFEAGGWRVPGVGVCVLGVGGWRAGPAFRSWLDGQPEAPSRVILAGLAGGLSPGVCVGDVFLVSGGSARLSGSLPEASMVTVDHVVATAREKRKLREQSRAVLCDMETSHLEAVCREAGIPWAGVRAVSDPADTDLPVAGSLLMSPAKGRPATMRMLAYVATRPRVWPEFAAMVKNASRAQRQLATVLSRVLSP